MHRRVHSHCSRVPDATVGIIGVCDRAVLSGMQHADHAEFVLLGMGGDELPLGSGQAGSCLLMVYLQGTGLRDDS